jgi:scyllo-inositol 2-dehydrogenase (NADP+)
MDARAVELGTGGRDGILTRPDGAQQTVPTERGDYPAFYEAVADAIVNGAPAPVDPADARAGLMLIDLARRAAELGKRLPVRAASSTGASAPAA